MLVIRMSLRLRNGVRVKLLLVDEVLVNVRDADVVSDVPVKLLLADVVSDVPVKLLVIESDVPVKVLVPVKETVVDAEELSEAVSVTLLDDEGEVIIETDDPLMMDDIPDDDEGRPTEYEVTGTPS